ncbi:hypothetical protein ACSVH5_02330 [Flavobacterium sp. RSSA_27]|uniref:hypothetical protein n=1 Tax=Flavobacterium sp. RSSA_27 TaxID=3447667 RepID=UPI003F307792
METSLSRLKTISLSLIEKNTAKNHSTQLHTKNIEVVPIQSNANNIHLYEVMPQVDNPVLVHINNNQLTSFLDCTGVTPYEMWYFDQNLQFTGKAYSINQNNGRFQIQTQAKWVLLINLNTTLFNELDSFHGIAIHI